MIIDQETAKKTAAYLLQINAIKLNYGKSFTWANGWQSPIYCDNRIALSYPEVRTYLRNQLASQCRELYGVNVSIAGVATGAIGMGMLVAQKLEVPFVYVRPEPKKHGRQNQIEGQVGESRKVVVIEDLISTGKSSLGAIVALRDAGAMVLGMLAIFNYGFEVADRRFKEATVNLHTLCDYEHLLPVAVADSIISDKDLIQLQTWRKNPSAWKNHNS